MSTNTTATTAKYLKRALNLLETPTLQDLRCGLVLDPHMCVGAWVEPNTQSHCLFGAAIYIKKYDKLASLGGIDGNLLDNLARATYFTEPLPCVMEELHGGDSCPVCGMVTGAGGVDPMTQVIILYDMWGRQHINSHRLLTNRGRGLLIKWIEHILHERAEKPECPIKATTTEMVTA